jgi:UDP-glucose 4-epimerase
MSSSIITGASGFVGRALMRAVPHARALAFGAADWQARLGSTDLRDAAVFHLAARVHRPSGRDDAAYQRDNVDKTVALARAAAAARARVFVFVSSIKVNGEETRERPFAATDEPQPEDAYGKSKWAAERALAEIAHETELPVHIVRPCLVYGPRAVGNLRALLRLCDSAMPLPFAAVHNRRSFVAVDDLVQLLVACAASPMRVATWLAAHPQPVSTPRLVAAMRAALGRKPRLFGVSPSVLEAAGRVTGSIEQVRRLTRSLEVDASTTIAGLGWTPRIGIDEIVGALVASYRKPTPR